MGCCGDSAVDNEWEQGKKGDPHELDEGPVKDRSCKDLPCLIIFIAFLGCGAFTLIWGGTKGNINRMLHGYDASGNVCGQQNAYIPGVNTSGKDMSALPYCEPNFSISSLKVLCSQCVNQCSNNKAPIINRCGEGTEVVDQTSNFLRNNLGALKAFFQEITDDIQKSWREIVYMTLVAFGLSLLVTVLLRFLAFWIIWIIIIVAVLGSIVATIALWIIWSQEKNILATMKADPTSYSDIAIRDKDRKVGYLFGGAIASTIVMVIVLLIILVMRKRIALVVALFKEAGRAVHAMPFLLLQPIWTCITLVIFCVIWLIGALIIENAGDPVIMDDGTVQYRLNPFFKGMRFYHIFSFFWMTQFFIACQHTTVAGAVGAWFFTRDKGKLHLPILGSMWRVFRYHLGSLAMGSFIIALVQMIRYLLSRLQKRVGQNNSAAGCIIKCCQCCLACFENFLKFLNRNAYVEIAIYGYSFCKAARQAFKLLTSNALRVFAINSIGDFVLFLAKAAIVIAVVFIGIEFMKLNNQGVTHYWFPVFLGACIALLISHTFISIFEMAVDTLFLCFCEDCERNDGVQRPYYMSTGLMEFVENSSKALKAMKDKEKLQKNEVVAAD